MEPGDELGPFSPDTLGQLLRRVVRSGGLLEAHRPDGGVGGAADGVSVSVSEMLALREVAAAATLLSQHDLGERLALEKSTVSRLISGLERRGWLIRERDPANRRFSLLQLTADGHAAAVHIARNLHRRHEALLSMLTTAEREGLLLGLTALAHALETPEAGRWPPEQ